MVRGGVASRLLFYVAASLCLVFVGCDTLSTITDSFGSYYEVTDEGPLYNYKADMIITIDGSTFDGLAVTELEGSNPFTVVSKARLDLLTITTCARHVTHEKVDKGWFGGVGKKFKYNFVPNKKESEGNCPIFIQAFDRNGRTAWGMIRFRTNENYPSTVSCNGSGWKFKGLTACQSKATLIQTISFKIPPVKFTSTDNCNLKKVSPTEFEVRPAVGFCYATFINGDLIHRAAFLGYKRAFVRGE